MKDILQNYVGAISLKFSHEETSEMGYRADFEILLKGIFESINVSRFDHDARAKQGNKPDFVVVKNDVPILYIETKDIGVSLDKIEKSEQMSRYFGYANLVLTDYVEFRFYRNGLPYGEPIKIAEYDKGNRIIAPFPNSFEYLAKTLLDFAQSHKEPIRSGKHLSKIMGGKAQRIRDNVRQFLSTESDKNVELVRVYETIKKLLVHDLTQDAFADMYAQTLVYGLFAARYHDESQESFSRQEARDLIPNSNPFLRHFFDHIVGPNFDKRLEYIVNELCEVFSHANIQELMREYFKVDLWGQTHSDPDPVIHFYEDFLKEYDPELRKKMGAYYTPLPVVQFIVRSIDYLLKKEFDLTEGLADTSKTSDGLHRVQILDPAVGTGTFISKIIRNIYEHLRQSGQEGRWNSYVLHDLLPRLHGFELMMTPYTIAHLKLSMAFRETGFKYFNNRRLGIYLTNSLEEGIVQEDLFTAFGLAESIAEESKEASLIKNEKPIMVVIGNPPYSVSSSNKGEWIQKLTKDYKKNLNERNIQPLSDDYIKFIRFAEHFIEKNNSGIVAMITNNSFLDGIIHRQMRKHLLETFDDIYILDLHGNAKKKETTPDGGKDENVFDIQQGVSINIFVRKEGEKKGLGKVHHSDLYGKRADKFETLNKSNLSSVKWQILDYSEPYYFFVHKNFEFDEKYNKGFGVDELFISHSSGVTTHRDQFAVDFKKEKLEERIKEFSDISISDIEIRNKFGLKNTSSFNLSESRIKVAVEDIEDGILKILYRPFDVRWIYYSTKIIDRDRRKVMRHMLEGNLGFIAKRGMSQNESAACSITSTIIDRRSWSRPGMLGAEQLFPLYLYSEDGTKISNFKQEIVDEIEKIVGKTTPENIFDYIYAVLHSPSYRGKYKEFLKINFPRVPYPKDKQGFKKLVEFGTELRQLHLLESPKVNKFITTYPESGSDVVDKPVYKNGKVYINDTQYFGNVPEIAWRFWVGGYQPAQKWLKDRKSRILTNEDIEHYQKIIVALTETEKIMVQIDKSIQKS